MAASARVNPEMIQSHRLGQEILVGFEFSGKDLRWYFLFEKTMLHTLFTAGVE